MRWVDKLLAPWSDKSSPALEQKSSLDLTTGFGALMFADVYAESAAGALYLYRTCSAVSVVINRIATILSTMDPMMVSKSGEATIDDAVLTLLDNPMAGWDRNLFFETLSKFFLATGNAYVWAGGSNNKMPLGIAPVNPGLITVVTDGYIATSLIVSEGPYSGTYNRVEEKGRIRFIRDEVTEILQIKAFNALDQGLAQGESPLSSVGPELRQLINGNVRNSSLLLNGGALSAAMSIKGDLTEDQLRDARSEVNRKYAGPDNAGTMAVVAAEDVTIIEFGKTPKDMDFQNLDRRARSVVAQQYGMPGLLVNEDAATFNNMDTARQMFFDSAVEPVADRLLGDLGAFLLFRDGRQQDARLTFDRMSIPSIRARTLAEASLRRSLGVDSINEIRARLGQEEVDGGAEIFQPATLVPITGVTSDPVVMAQTGDEEDVGAEPEAKFYGLSAIEGGRK